MWKKITYYALMIIFGILFMMMIMFSVFSGEEQSFIEDSINSGDYTNALKEYSSFSNTNPVYENLEMSDKSELRVFEVAYTNIVAPTSEKYNYLDIEYAIALENSTINKNNPAASDDKGTVKNQFGYIVINSLGEKFQVYANGYVDGNATSKENAYLVKDKNGSTVNEDGEEYGSIAVANNYYEPIYMLYIPSKLLNEYSGFTTFDIKTIKIVDNCGNTYQEINFDTALSYNSPFFNKINEMLTTYNECVDANSFEAYNNIYSEWEKSFLELDGANIYLKPKDYTNGWTWFKIVISAILYILFVLVLGDVLVGKRRIIKFFQNIGKNKNSGGSFQQPQGIKKAQDAPDLMDNNKKGE